MESHLPEPLFISVQEPLLLLVPEHNPELLLVPAQVPVPLLAPAQVPSPLFGSGIMSFVPPATTKPSSSVWSSSSTWTGVP